MEIYKLFSVKDKTIIVTGGSAGLGLHSAKGLAAMGSKVVIVGRRADRLEHAKQQVELTGQRCVAVAGDVSDPETADRTVSAAMEAFGKVDVLLNNAGIASAVPATREKPEDFLAVHGVNVGGAYWMAQACGRVMDRGASIINVSSILALRFAGLPQAAYSSSKAALLGLTRDLAGQWCDRKGIRVNAIVPGWFDTEMTAAYPGEYARDLVSRIPMGRKGTPDEFVAVVVFLASDASSYITGAVLPVDGGALI